MPCSLAADIRRFSGRSHRLLTAPSFGVFGAEILQNLNWYNSLGCKTFHRSTVGTRDAPTLLGFIPLQQRAWDTQTSVMLPWVFQPLERAGNIGPMGDLCGRSGRGVSGDTRT